MKSLFATLLFWSLALVHLAAQFTMLYIYLHTVDQDAEHYDAAKDFDWASRLAIISFPGCLLLKFLPEPGSQLVFWVVTTVLFVLNGTLWSGVICTILSLCFRLFRSRSSRVV